MSDVMAPHELWDVHGPSLLAVARTLLGDESAAQRAVASALTTFYQDHGSPEPIHALRGSARYVFAHSEAIRSGSTLVSFEAPGPLRRMALNQRRMLALCTYGGHTYRDAALLMGISADTAARLLTTALKRRR